VPGNQDAGNSSEKKERGFSDLGRGWGSGSVAAGIRILVNQNIGKAEKRMVACCCKRCGVRSYPLIGQSLRVIWQDLPRATSHELLDSVLSELKEGKSRRSFPRIWGTDISGRPDSVTQCLYMRWGGGQTVSWGKSHGKGRVEVGEIYH